MRDYLKPETAGKKLLIVSLHADPAGAAGAGGGGGTHSYLRELLVALPRRGWSCTVVTRWAATSLPEHQRISASARIVRIRIGDVAPIDKRLLDGLHAQSLAGARAVAGEEKTPALLHSVYWNSGRVAMDLSAEIGVPFVHTVISNGLRRQLQGAGENAAERVSVERRVFAAAHRIFCISAEERDDLATLYGVDPRKLVVVGRPVSVSYLTPPHDEMGIPRLLPPWDADPPVGGAEEWIDG